MFRSFVFKFLIVGTLLIGRFNGFVIFPSVQHTGSLNKSTKLQSKGLRLPVVSKCFVQAEKNVFMDVERVTAPVYGSVQAAALTMTMALMVFVGNPSGAVAASADIAQGSVLFEANCAGCHRGGVNLINESKTLKKEALEKYLSLDQPKIQEFVQNQMPHKFLPFHSAFTEKEFLDVTTYVLDQAVGQKW